MKTIKFKLAVSPRTHTEKGVYDLFTPEVEGYVFNRDNHSMEYAAEEYLQFFYECVPVGIIDILKRKMKSL
jgi:hypothetical protein